MRLTSLRNVAAPMAALMAVACFPVPGFVDKAHVPVAQQYYRGCERGSGCTAAADALPLDQLFAVHAYGRSFHPWRSAANHIARRGPAAVPFLRERLAGARGSGEVAVIFEVFTAMQDTKSFDVRSDPALVALIQQAAHRFDDPGYFLRDEADELETGDRRPFSPSVVGRKWLHPNARDYDVAFAKAHCRGCDFRDWKAGVETLPIDQLYALYRLGWEDFHPTRNIEPEFAAHGAAAIPFIKTKLAEANDGLMLFNLISLLERMRDTGTYQPSADPELLTLVDAAVARVKGSDASDREAAQRLRTGAPHPLAELRAR